jgi:hypothetical protein
LLCADVCKPVIDIESDFGKFVGLIFFSPSKFLGKTILAATECLTVKDFARAYERVHKEHVNVRILKEKEALEIGEKYGAFVHELIQMAYAHNQFGCYDDLTLEASHALNDKLELTSFEQWLRRPGFSL